MVVADTGNDRLQIFHVEQLPVPLDLPHGAMEGNGGTSYRKGSPHSSLTGGLIPPLNDSTIIDSWSSHPMGASASAHTPSAPKDETKVYSPPGEDNRAGRGARLEQRLVEGQLGIPGLAGGDVGGSLPPDHDVVDSQEARSCLLVFSGCESACLSRSRRTAGESEAGEGPLCQPCHTAYWRRTTGASHSRSRSRPSANNRGNVSRVWRPQTPPWYRRCATSSEPDGEREESLRKELLSTSGGLGLLDDDDPPKTQVSGSTGISAEDDTQRSEFPGLGAGRRENENSRSNVRTSVGGGGGKGKTDGREPQLGAFVVRETGVPGELQLLFVAKPKVPLRDPWGWGSIRRCLLGVLAFP